MMFGSPLYVLSIPFPPSVNGYYLNAARRRPGGGSYVARMISPDGVRFRAEVSRCVRIGHRSPPRLSGRLAIAAIARPPSLKANGARNANRRDLDNLWKSTLDALTYAGVILDDCLFDQVGPVVRGNPVPGGSFDLGIWRADPSAEQDLFRAMGVIGPMENLIRVLG